MSFRLETVFIGSVGDSVCLTVVCHKGKGPCNSDWFSCFTLGWHQMSRLLSFDSVSGLEPVGHNQNELHLDQHKKKKKSTYTQLYSPIPMLSLSYLRISASASPTGAALATANKKAKTIMNFMIFVCFLNIQCFLSEVDLWCDANCTNIRLFKQLDGTVAICMTL